jgi:hypothetical protein
MKANKLAYFIGSYLQTCFTKSEYVFTLKNLNKLSLKYKILTMHKKYTYR